MNEIILEILKRQKKEWETKKEGTYVPRFRLLEARQWLSSPLIKVVIGPRRAGKSVFASLLLREKRSAYLNFDEVAFAGTVDLERVIDQLREVYGEYDVLFIDEVQNLPGWELFLNRLQREGVNVIVSGSNANLLSGEFATHLTGRYALIEVLPFCFDEYLRARRVDPSSSNAVLEAAATAFMREGGYPGAVLGESPDPKGLMQTLADAVVGKDIVLRHSVRKAGELSAVLHWGLSNVAKETSFERLTGQHAIFGLPKSRVTVQRYLGYFQEAYMTEIIGRFDLSAKERTKSPKKIYAVDNGMALAVGFRTSPDNGRLFENMVYGELRKLGRNDIRYYRSVQGGKECDFVIRRGHETEELLQACWDMSDAQTRKRELAGIADAARITRCPNATIVTMSEEGEEVIGDLRVQVVPFHSWATGLHRARN